MMQLHNVLKNTSIAFFTVKCLRYSSSVRCVLGIESTFDDTGAAIVDEHGKVLGESLITQSKEHAAARGVDPRLAQRLHRKHLPIVVDDVMKQAGLRFQDLQAVATATRPGLPYCLLAGLEFTKTLIQDHGVPFIPVHHMEAHLLTPRLECDVTFPFLTLLASGGHCILSIAHSLGDYDVLGTSLDEPPGAVFDKVARALLIVEDQEEGGMSSGRDLEELARSGDLSAFEVTVPFAKRPDRHCDFSFSGLQSVAFRRIRSSTPMSGQRKADIAAVLQHSAVRHIVKQVHRAVLYCEGEGFLRGSKLTLVVSGGVSCNQYLRNALSKLCDVTGMSLVTPSLRLCTDNGVMIAWTGVEYLKAGRGISEEPMLERYKPKSLLGRHMGAEVRRRHIKLPKVNYFVGKKA